MNDIRLAQLSMFISKAKEIGNPNHPPLVELFDEVMEQRKRVKEMQKTLERCLPYIEPEVDQQGYGFFPGGDPTKFIPDEENSPREIDNWKEACNRWNENKEGTEGSHRWLTDGNGNVIGTATVANLGMGIYNYEDEEAKEIVEFIQALKGETE